MLQIIMDYVSCDMKCIIDIEITINNDLLVTSWQNIERNKWNIMHELVLQIVTQQLGYKKHCAKSTGWWLFTLAAGDLQKLNLCGSSQFVENHLAIFLSANWENASTGQCHSSSVQSLPTCGVLSLWEKSHRDEVC